MKIARMPAEDMGVVFRHGNGPDRCDVLGARDIWIYEVDDTYYMTYDGAAADGWLACLATSKDLQHWSAEGPILQLGSPGSEDSGAAVYGTTYFDGQTWHMFYVGTPNTTPPPERIPAFPYLTLYARGKSHAGPWIKDPSVIPFRPEAGTFYSATASPGFSNS